MRCESIGGDYEGGIADLNTAIRLDPNDPATKLEASPKSTLTAAAIQHGDEQVRQMLRDRPVMARFGDKAGVLYQWTANRFAGENSIREILWDAAEPVAADSDSRSATAERPGRIRVRTTYSYGVNKGKEQSFEALWSKAVFELYNVANGLDVQKLVGEAAAGQLTKEAFVTKIVECESRAAEKTRAFYIHVFLPWAKVQHVQTDPKSWFVAMRSNPREDLLMSRVDKHSTYWKHYEYRYDTILLTSLAMKGENEKVIDLATKLIEHAMPGENTIIFEIRGRAHAIRGEYDKAIADFTEAIRLNTKSAEAYCGRGIIYLEKGDLDNAIADISEAIRLDPKFPQGYYNRGNVYVRKDNAEKAIADFTQAIRLDPRHRDTYVGRGVAYNSKGEYDNAIADFTEAIRLDPMVAYSYYNRGAVYHRQGKLDKAIADYTEAIRLNPKYIQAYTGRRVAYEKKGEKAKAAADFAQAKKLGYKAP